MRYTEASLTPIGYQMMADIKKNTCDFRPNFDNTEEEPCYLPGLLPNILMMAVDGIAVGMATKMPSYNLTEVLDAVIFIIDKITEGIEPDPEDIYKIIKGPDFPLGGYIVGKSGVYSAFKTGKGKIKIRGKYEVKDSKNGSEIIITEIPYQVNKASLVSKMNDLSEDIPDIKEVRDESDKSGISIVVDLKKNANVQLVINKLLKQTDLEITFSVNNTVLVNGQPKVLNLMEILDIYFNHCLDVIKRRSEFDLNKSKERLHIVEGIIWAISDEKITNKLIQLIRSLKSEEAIEKIIEFAGKDNQNNNLIDAIQAKEIIEIRLKTLTTDNKEKYINESKQLNDEINRLTEIINEPLVLLQQLKTELIDLKEEYGDERRTQFINDDTIDEIDCIEDETLVITLSSNGIIKSVEEKEYRSTNRGAKGNKAANVKEDEVIRFMLTLNSKSDLLFFTSLGKCHVLKAYKIDKSSRTTKGKSINNYLSLEPNENIVSMISADLSMKDNSFAFVTRNGIIKRLSFESLSTVRSVTRVISFKEDDMLVTASVVDDNDHIIITTSCGMSIRFAISDIRPSGRLAAGVKAITLQENDFVVDSVKVEENSTILTVTEKGLAKRSDFDLYNPQARGGKGTRTHKLNDKTGNLVCATSVHEDDELFIATLQGQIARIDVSTIRTAGKSTSGVKIMNLNPDDKIISISRHKKEEVESEE